MTLTADFKKFLGNLDGTSAHEIFEVLYQAGHRPKPRLAASHTISSRIQKKRQPSPDVTKTTKKEVVSKVKPTDVGPKRPVNRWMAFRQYYSSSLDPIPQIVRSRILKTFWDVDPFHDKWNTLVLAYKELRVGRTKQEVPIGNFLSVCAPIIGIIPPENYQSVLGWRLVPGTDNNQEPVPERLFVPEYLSIPSQFRESPLGINHLLNYCKDIGFGMNSADDTATSQQPSAMSTQSETALQKSRQEPQGFHAYNSKMQIESSFNPSAVEARFEDNAIWTSYSVKSDGDGYQLLDHESNILELDLY